MGIALLLFTASCGATGADWEEPEQLHSISWVEPGEECPAGGYAVSSGPDLNGNEELDEDEILSVTYICHGYCGKAGSTLRIARRVDWDALVASGCTHVVGDLEISGRGLTRLFGTASVERVAGEMRVVDTDSLTTLSGLEYLRFVDGSLIINRNDVLDNLNGLASLESVGPAQEDLRQGESLTVLLISENPNLTSFSGLHSLRWVGGDMVLRSNRAVMNLTGLRSLYSVGGRLEISANPAMTSLDGAGSLRFVGEFVRAGADPSLIEGGLHIVGNHNLSSTAGLEALESIGGPLRVFENLVLAGLEGLVSLETVGEVSILDNRGLRSLRGLESLSWVGGDFSIERNFVLRSILSLGSVVSIGRNLRVTDNTELPSCQAYEFRDSLIDSGWAGTYSIRGNDDHATCD